MNSMKYPNIEAERVRHNLSQEDLTQKIDVTRKTYYNWLCSGEIPVSALVNLAELYDCSIDYLLGRTRNPSPYPKR